MTSSIERITAGTIDKVFVSAPGTRLLRAALRLLADGEPISLAQLADAAGVPDPELAAVPAGRDIEYDEHGRIVGAGLTLRPTPHRFTVNGHQLYTWCAPDTLIFPTIIGQLAHVESDCPLTGGTVRLTVDPARGVTDLDPAGAVVTVVDPGQVDTGQVRATLCDPQRFLATRATARDWQNRYPGMTVLPVADAYREVALPIAQTILDA